MSEESMRGKIQAGQFKRQAAWAENENKLFLDDAKKNALTRFFTVVKKYDLSEEDIGELLEISQFLI